MELRIYTNTGIREVKKQFSRFFPFLKIEFYPYCPKPKKITVIAEEPYYGLYVAETSGCFKEGVLAFSPATTVTELEWKFLNELELAIKIFRRAGDSWTDTAGTKNLTLGKQNNMGASLFRPVKINTNTLFL